MFYKKRIEALESRVGELEKTVTTLSERVQAQGNEIELLWAQFAGTQKAEAKPTPRRHKRKPCPNFAPIDGKENTKATK